MNLAEETEAYQAMLETRRAHDFNEEIEEDVEKAKAAMEIAWINHHIKEPA